MRNETREQLKIIGLDDNVIVVYGAILSLGKCSVSDIARQTAIKRSTVYLYLDDLLAQGLIAKTTDKKRMQYVAEDPKLILQIVEKKKSELDAQRKRLETAIPELQSLYYASFDKPAINFYEGVSGIKAVYRKFVETHKNIYSIFSHEAFFRFFTTAENRELLTTLYDSGGALHCLIERSELAEKEIKTGEYKEFVKYKYLPEKFKFETDLLITGNQIALISFKNLVAVVIEDEAIASLQKQVFKLLWKLV